MSRCGSASSTLTAIETRQWGELTRRMSQLVRRAQLASVSASVTASGSASATATWIVNTLLPMRWEAVPRQAQALPPLEAPLALSSPANGVTTLAPSSFLF